MNTEDLRHNIDFYKWTVNTVFESNESLLECLNCSKKKKKKIGTLCVSTRFIKLIQDMKFSFYSDFFHKLMAHVDIHYNQLQTKDVNVVKDKTSLLNVWV